jgi:hypothetical protein
MPYKNQEKAKHYQREYRRTRRAGDLCTTPGTTPLPVPFRLQTAADILSLIEEQVQAVRSDGEAGTLDKARVIGFLAGVALRAVETRNVAGRLEALESVLKARESAA